MVDIRRHGPAKRVEDPQAMEVFRHQWQLYTKMLDHNYFAHREVYAILHDVLTGHFNRSFRFLDLACGDCAGIVEVLRSTAVSYYRGVDLSRPALELARRNLEGLHCEVELEEADFMTAMRERPANVDAAWVGLSLHHISHAGKRELMRDVRKVLGDDGLFLIYEPTLEQSETREAYVCRFERTMRASWTALAENELDEGVRHVSMSDLPETAETWQRLAREAGFGRTQELLVHPARLYALFSFHVDGGPPSCSCA